MRASQLCTVHRWGAAVLLAAVLVSAAPPAQAEAPFFYDPLGAAALYDPEFYPLNRTEGLLVLMGQAWSQPDNGDGRQALTEQDYTAEYRMRWIASLDPRYSLLVELKASDRDRIVADDYFLKAEFLYQGMDAPLFVYGGLRLPEKTDFMAYAGLESMSYRLSDIIPGMRYDTQLAFRGFAEVRYDLDADDPVLRLMALAHTLPLPYVPGLLLSTGIDSFFMEGAAPRWLLEAHAEYALRRGVMGWSLIGGYSLDLEDGGEQRASLGVRAELF